MEEEYRMHACRNSNKHPHWLSWHEHLVSGNKSSVVHCHISCVVGMYVGFTYPYLYQGEGDGILLTTQYSISNILRKTPKQMFLRNTRNSLWIGRCRSSILNEWRRNSDNVCMLVCRVRKSRELWTKEDGAHLGILARSNTVYGRCSFLFCSSCKQVLRWAAEKCEQR